MIIRFKKQLLPLCLALLAPIVLTYATLALLPKAEVRIPVGLVVEEQTELAQTLVSTLQSSPVLTVQLLTTKQALQALEKHELDSVFVIKDGFEATILANKRAVIVEGYHSNMSLMYEVASELVSSRTLQLVGQQQTVQTIQQLDPTSVRAEIIESSNDYFQHQPLLSTTIHYQDSTAAIINHTNEQALGIWAIFATLASFLHSEWLRKELTPALKLRLPFSKISSSRYILTLVFCYVLLFFITDTIALVLFSGFSSSALLALISFRITIATMGYVLALLAKSALGLYQLTLLFSSLLFFTSGIMLAVPDVLRYLQPILALNTSVSSIWLIIAPVLFLLLLRKEMRHV